jgi:hypothetical protein
VHAREKRRGCERGLPTCSRAARAPRRQAWDAGARGRQSAGVGGRPSASSTVTQKDIMDQRDRVSSFYATIVAYVSFFSLVLNIELNYS